MISLIKFDNNLIITIEEAISLGLNYQEIEGTNIRVGYSTYYNKMSKLNSYEYYTDDERISRVEVDEEGNEKYYKIISKKGEENKEEEISDSYLYKRVDITGKVFISHSEEQLVDLFKFAPICRHPYKIVKTIKSDQSTMQSIEYLLHIVEEKITKFNEVADVVSNNTFNSKTNVHIGGGLLASYNDLMLKEDICTDELQVELNNGWRIIAVCVQPDQRRPDYILGRYNPILKVKENERAKR